MIIPIMMLMHTMMLIHTMMIMMLDNASAWAPQPAWWVGSDHRERERNLVRSAHHAQINEPLQRPQVRRQCILNCRLSLQLYREKLLHREDEKGAEEEFCGRLNL